MQGVIGKAVAIDARDSHYQVVCGAGLLVVLDGASPLGTSPIILLGNIRLVATTRPAALTVGKSLELVLILKKLTISTEGKHYSSFTSIVQLLACKLGPARLRVPFLLQVVSFWKLAKEHVGE